MKSFKVHVLLTVFFLSINAYSQYGVIEMKNGDFLEMGDERFSIEGDQFKYFKEKIDPKDISAFGVRDKKKQQEYLDKINAVNIKDIKVIHTKGELFVSKKKIANYIGLRFIKIKNKYQLFYVIEEGKCSLLIMPENSNAIFSFYVQEGNKEPYIIHKSGTGTGPKYKNRSSKYFADCKPAMDYIKNDLKLLTLPELIQIYNENCAK